MISNVKHASLIQKGLNRVVKDLRTHILNHVVGSEELCVELQAMIGAIGRGYNVERLSLTVGAKGIKVVMSTNAGIYITDIGNPVTVVSKEGPIDSPKIKIDLESQFSESEIRRAIFKLAGEPDNIILNMGKGNYYLYYCRRGISGKMMGIDEVVAYVMEKDSTTSVIPYDRIKPEGR